LRDGQALTHRSRNTEDYRRLLKAVVRANPSGDLYLKPTSSPITKLIYPSMAGEAPPGEVGLYSVGASWLNLLEVWWRLFGREALAGQTFERRRDLESCAGREPTT